MKKIFPLSPHVIAKIAAGEVIERPVFAVKELVENALDAGADRITVRIEESGLKEITVIDNGTGMSKEDLLESYKPHTTSKLTAEEQLAAMRTLGFRGEALASIASISHLTISSRPRETEAGYVIELQAGEVIKEAPFGMPPGTIVTVRNLFYTVPGRKNFLKSARTEARHILDYLTRIALQYPNVSFAFSHNNKVMFDLPKTDTQRERIPYLLGEQFFANVLPIETEEGSIRLSGFLTKPQSATLTAQRQYLAVNNRIITDKMISTAIKDAYGTLIEQTAHPAFVLNVVMPPEFVDVNVHPRKENVRYVDPTILYETLFAAVKQTLGQHKITPVWGTHIADDGGIAYGDGKSWRVGQVNSYAGRLLKEKRIPWSPSVIEEVGSTTLVQLHDVYLVTQTKFGILLVDQHAAHERILYEQILHTFREEKKEQPQFILTKPVLIDMSFSEKELIQEHIPLLQQAGFSIEYFKDTAFLVHAVPLLFQDRNIPELLSELLADLWEERRSKDLDRVSHRMIAYLACRGSVKAGDRLTKKQMQELPQKLQQTPNNATCPHGRPTRIEITKEKLERMFKRK